ncbi:CPBP family intramembrane glutamic endopeptidase [Pseudonocardia sp.]|uniref:CPBP family intramembrane glutamic endopeptidase n=1 Tax=Pseudonocardia sp. TaxID=60912 RepID=UPI003D0AEFF1
MSVRGARGWARFLLGFVLLYAVLAGLAELDPTGASGVAIFGAVLLAAMVVQRGGPRTVGLGRPAPRALGVAFGVSLLVLLVYPLTTAVTGAQFALRPGWVWLLVGVFAMHGLAEELVWRGYAFARLREGRSFGRAVVATMPLIAATHIPIIAGSGLAVGLAAMLVAAVTALPLAYLYETGGNTVWAPAVVHTAIDSFKLVIVPTESVLTFSLLLAAVSIVVPLLAVAVPRRLLVPDRRPARRA